MSLTGQLGVPPRLRCLIYKVVTGITLWGCSKIECDGASLGQSPEELDTLLAITAKPGAQLEDSLAWTRSRMTAV